MIHRWKEGMTMNRNISKGKEKGKQIIYLLRLIRYMAESYKANLIAVVIFILSSSLFMVRGTMYTKDLMDKYIIPYINEGTPDFIPLLKMIGIMALV